MSDTPGLLDDLPPTQDLIVEVLAARWRLGQHMWTVAYGPGMRRALRLLEEAGIISTRSHNASPKHVYAELTVKGIEAYFGIDGITRHATPLEIERNRLKLERDNLRRTLNEVGLS